MNACCRTLAVGLVIVTCGCGRDPQGAGGTATGQDRAPAESAGEVRMAMAAPPAAPQAGGTRTPVPVPSERKVIRNGTLELEVPSLGQALTRIRTETEKAGGYITSEAQGSDEYGAREGSIVCRLPAGRLDQAMALFQAIGRVESVNVTADDITEQYFNLEIRLRNQRQLEERFLKLLDRPGNKMAELLEVEREVARVRGEIDELEGRQRFWDSQVAFSTLTVRLQEPRPVIAGGGGGILDTLKRAFKSAGDNLVSTIAWLIAAAGAAIPAFVALWVLWRVWRAVRARRRNRV